MKRERNIVISNSTGKDDDHKKRLPRKSVKTAIRAGKRSEAKELMF